MHVTGSQAAWTLAAIITLALYVIALWLIWHKRNQPTLANSPDQIDDGDSGKRPRIILQGNHSDGNGGDGFRLPLNADAILNGNSASGNGGDGFSIGDGTRVSQTHNGIGDNVFNEGKQPFVLTAQIMNEWANTAEGWGRPFGVSHIGGNPKSAELALQLLAFLKGKGLDAHPVGSGGMMPGFHGPIFKGIGDLSGNPNPASSDPIIYLNADG